MAAINWTRLLIILLTVLVAVALAVFAVWLLLHVAAELLLFFLAAVLAYLLDPAVSAAQRATRAPRPAAILLVYAGLAVVVALLAELFVPPMAEQARLLQARLPSLLHELNVRSSALDQVLRAHGLALPVRTVSGNAVNAIGGVGPGLIGGALGIVSSVGTALLDAGLVLVMAFYLLSRPPLVEQRVAALLPPRYAAGLSFTTHSAGLIIGRYVRAQLAVAAMVGLLGGGGAAALGVQYAPLIGLFAFIAESIPVLGPIIATIPAVLIAALESPWKAVAVLGWFVVVQQLEQNVIMPRLSGQAVGIHPVAAIMAVLIGFRVGALWGALFAVPVLGFASALAREGLRVYLASSRAPTAVDDDVPLSAAGRSGP